MQQLPNNCRCGKMSVFPANWKTPRANIKQTWYIKYRFYDDALGKSKQIVIKGMNDLTVLSERRHAVALLLESEVKLITEKGFNPITKRYPATSAQSEVSPDTPFCAALSYAVEHLDCTALTKRDIRNTVSHVRDAAVKKGYDQTPIKDVKQKILRIVLSEAGAKSANYFNHHRKYLSMLFVELKEYECVETNFVRDVSKKKTGVKKIRKRLSPEDRKKVNDHLRENYYPFWRFFQIFFHSSSRITEMMSVKRSHVDLQNQTFKVTVRKGRLYQEQQRTIKNIALPIWRELCEKAKPNQYLFSEGLTPGDVRIDPIQITNRWRRHVKEKLGIDSDFYALKHSNLTEIRMQLSIADASRSAGHTSERTTSTFYIDPAVEADMLHERLKSVDNNI